MPCKDEGENNEDGEYIPYIPYKKWQPKCAPKTVLDFIGETFGIFIYLRLLYKFIYIIINYI